MPKYEIDFNRPGRDSSPVLTIADIRGAGMCAPGLAAWFEENGINYRDFKAGMYRICDFEDMNNGYAQQVLAYAKKQRGVA